MRPLLTSIFLISLFSCAGTPTLPATPADAISEFLKGTPFTHFASACRVYDLNGRFAAFAEGDNCVIEPDGAHYSRSMSALRYTGADLKPVWENPIKLSHHQIFHSKVSGRFLAVNSDFKNWNGLRTRFDVLVLLNENGKIIQKFSFYDFLKNHPDVLLRSRPGKTNWFYRQTGVEKDIYELTHTNSFIELTRTEADGSKTVTGYLSNCTYQSRFYILDPSLTRVIKVIDLNDRSTHAVSQIDNDRLLFYRNSTIEKPVSSAEIYNLAANTFTTLYTSNNPYLSASACSSAQLLTPEKLLLSHSQCVSSDNKADYGLAVEFVNLAEKKSFYFPLHKVIRHSNTYLIDGRKFVESRPKL